MFSLNKTRCDDAQPENSKYTPHPEHQHELSGSAPPKMPQVESFESKAYRKFTSQPLIPIGCLATTYFLVSGIKSFQERNPVRSQKMMQMRVAAQFATLLAFIGYVGLENFDMRLAPMYQEKKKADKGEAPTPGTRRE